MKTKALAILSILLASSASFAAAEMTLKEKQSACKSIIDTLDYNEGSSVSLCVSGKWIVSDVEMGRGNRQVAFSWEGKASIYQRKNDGCIGYVLTKVLPSRKITMSVFDLDCK